MSGSVHILRGPSGSGKTTRLIERCRAVGEARGGTILWLGPSRRRLESLRTTLAAVSGLRLLTIPELAGEVLAANRSTLFPLSRCQSRLLVDEVLTELHSKSRLRHFGRVIETRGFASNVVSLVAELQQQGISPESFDVSSSEGELAAIYTHYVQRLKHLGLCDHDGRVTNCLETLRENPNVPPLRDLRAVFVDDMRLFRPPERELLKFLSESCAEMWIALSGEDDGDRAELFSRSILSTQYSVLSTQYSARPTGLSHLERNLFRPIRAIVPSSDASGVSLIEAPGMVGEARRVARRIKTLLREGVAAQEIMVSVRDLTPYADLLREVFDEYGIPVDVEGTDALQRDPTVGLLLRALRLPEEEWPFSGVTALLRSNWLRPPWPEAQDDPERPLQCEALLRLLAVPRGKDAILESARRQAARPDEGLEDEQAEESRRRRKHELAKECLPFLERFFQAWDEMPLSGPLEDHVGWLKSFVKDLGFTSPSRAWCVFWEEIAHWLTRSRPLDRRTFHRRLQALAISGGTARTPRGPGRVRVLSASMACDLDADYLFVLGLGEGSFPNLSLPCPLIDEASRQALRSQGLELPSVNDLLVDEMLLFYRLLTRPRKQLVLSYPAVDSRGQPLLPGSFLSAVLDLFTPGTISVERRNMLTEEYDHEEPLSSAEQRVRIALNLDKETGRQGDRERVPIAVLRDARDMARRRFQRDFGPFDGWFRDPLAVAESARLFGTERVFSPTALEDYVACPFRFMLRHVLRLEPLEEPREEIEVTRRGQTFHRALARLHRKLKGEARHEPDDQLDEEMRRQLDEAIQEDVARAPGPAAKMLWHLEGLRMLKVATRYGEQWKALVEPWQKQALQPQPHHFEIGFGLPPENAMDVPHVPLVLREGAIEVRISGRIDRVDIAERGDETLYWIIDYKTGRGTSYTPKALAEFERLQLTLYALAVEEVLLAGRKARPLGLAYWLIGEQGPKVVLPSRNPVLWLDDGERWRAVRKTLEEWVVSLVKNIREGIYPLKPRKEDCTQTCDYGEICRISQSRVIEKSWAFELPLVPTQSESR